ncbi:aminoglycoside phosphotransferase family protein [Streptomyces sp. NPDC028635]|uniref:aminoglycoside phosphotransferase family protein n=1 Tax=Streptomyces sp. NPDC028635 TaxID=3154800 RepID=UPI0033DB1B05
MHEGEASTDPALVRRLLRDQFPRWAHLPVTRLASGGTVNAIYRLGDELTVRLPLLAGGAEDLDDEARWLPRLAPLLPVPIPEVVALGEPAEGYPHRWAIHRWLDGEVLHEGEASDDLARDLAAFVTTLRRAADPAHTAHTADSALADGPAHTADGPAHTADGPAHTAADPSHTAAHTALADGPRAYRGAPLRTVDDGTRAAIEELRRTDEPFDADALLAAWDTALQAPDWTAAPCWTHSDLMPGNLLGAGGRLAGVLDFGTAGVGDPAVDLIPAWNLLTPGTRRVFRDGADTDDATWARGRGWALSMAATQLPYYRHTNPVISANARYVLHQILDDR